MRKLYLDIETTGLDADHDELLQIAIIDDNANIVFESNVKPVENKSWREAQAIHGITPKDVENAPTLYRLLPQIHQAIADSHLIIYNAPFDIGFIPSVLDHVEVVDCCMTRFAQFNNEWDKKRNNYQWKKLTEAAEIVAYDWIGKPHTAVADCLATKAVWNFLELHDPFCAVCKGVGGFYNDDGYTACFECNDSKEAA